jgi:transcriptional regulator with XRE-family HTH domain
MTTNQAIAYNLQLARSLRGLTQEQAAERIALHLGGKPWTKQNYSAAERSVTGARVRQFSADEIMAFAKAFELDVGFFFQPPLGPDPFHRWPVVTSPTDVPDERLVSDVDLADKLIPEPEGWIERLERGLEGADPATRERILERLERLSKRLYAWTNNRERQRATAADEEVS